MTPNPFFGPNIKLLRTRRGRSQEETAIALDVKRSSYSGYENGTAEPSFDLLVRLSEPGADALVAAVDAVASELEQWRHCFVVLTGRKIRIHRP